LKEGYMVRQKFAPIVAMVVALVSLTLVSAAHGQRPPDELVQSGMGQRAFKTGEVIVKLRAGVILSPDATRTNRGTLAVVLDSIGARQAEQVFSSIKLPPTASELRRVYRVMIDPRSDELAAAAKLSADPNVEYAEPNYLARAAAMPNDTLFASQWALAQINAPMAWDVVTGTSEVVLAILDTGLDVAHPDLANQLWFNPGETPGNDLDDDTNGYVDDVNGWNFIALNNEIFDDDGHGTRVAGIAAAATNNGQGVAGVCWNCRLMPVKVMQAGGVANYSDIALGIMYAAGKGAKVINLSLGGYADSATLREVISAASETAMIVAAAGDDNTSAPFYPAAYPHVIAVGGTTASDARAVFSNHGSSVDHTTAGLTSGGSMIVRTP
jgi:subtilisin family serine protease